MRQKDKKAKKQRDRERKRYIDRNTLESSKQKDTKAKKQRDIETKRQKDRETERLTCRHFLNLQNLQVFLEVKLTAHFSSLMQEKISKYLV